MLEQVRPQAVERIQARLVLEAVAKEENITVSDDEFEAELKKMAEQYKMELDKLKELMPESELNEFYEEIKERRDRFLRAWKKRNSKM